MNWHNLDKNKCPSCSSPVGLLKYYNPVTKNYNCSCGFRISEAKFKLIVSGHGRDNYRKKPYKPFRPYDENPE